MAIGHNPRPLSQLGMHLPEVQTWWQRLGPHRLAKNTYAMQEELPEGEATPTEGDQGTGAAGAELKCKACF